jgi:O-antigen/teichoic acid export membrane protein
MTTGESAPRRGGMMRNLVHLGIGQVATTVLTILLNAAVARALSPSDFGLMYLLTSIATFAYVVVDWGYGPYIIREAARHPERAGELLGSAMAARAVIALLACTASVGITWALGYEVRTRLLAGALILGWLPQYLGLSFGWIFRSRERMDRDAQINVMHKLAILLASIACLTLGGHVQALIVVWSGAGLLTLAIAFLMYRGLGLPKFTVKMATARELLRGGAPIFAMTLAVAIEPFFNANILYKVAAPEVVGWYGAAWVIAGTLIAPATVLGSTIYPRLSAAAGNAATFKRAFDMSFRPLLLVAVLGAVGTFLFAEVPISLIYGARKFGPAAETLRAFAPALLLLFVDIFFAMAILAAGKSGRLAGAKVASVVLTTGLVFLLVPVTQARFANGGLGVMYALAIGELLMLVVSVILIRDALGSRTVGDALRCVLAGAATMLLFRMLPAFSPFLAIPLCVLVYGGLSLLVGAVRRSDIQMLLTSRK